MVMWVHKAQGDHVALKALFQGIVNKGSLVNGGFVGKDSLAPTLRTLLDGISSQKLNTSMLLVEGTPSSHYILYKYDNSQGLTYCKVGSDVQLTISLKNPSEHGIYNYELFLSFVSQHGHNILLYGDCVAGSVNTILLYWPKSRTDFATTMREQNNVKSGYFHQCAEKECQVYGSFRYSGNKLINRGVAYSINTHGGPVRVCCSTFESEFFITNKKYF